jgi:protein-S-isoprenylcysteine O-methyltransferase Ste14
MVFLAGFIVYFAIRGVFIERTKKNEKALTRVDVAEKLLLPVVAVGAMLLPLLYLFTPLLNFADLRLPAAVPACGAAVMAIALWLFWRSHTDLGLNWSVTLETRKGHELVTNGVYRRVRHPMYAAIWLFSLVQALLLENWLAGPAALLCFAPLYFRRIPREEKLMLEAFGEPYRAYMDRTGRVIPRLNSSSREG